MSSKLVSTTTGIADDQGLTFKEGTDIPSDYFIGIATFVFILLCILGLINLLKRRGIDFNKLRWQNSESPAKVVGTVVLSSKTRIHLVKVGSTTIACAESSQHVHLETLAVQSTNSSHLDGEVSSTINSEIFGTTTK